MSIIVTGATGGLGHQTLIFLSQFASPSTPIIGTTRDLSRAPSIPNVTFRAADFNKPSTLDAAFAGAAKVLIVSTDSFDNDLRLVQHKNAVDACVRAGVGHVYYTSLGICGHRENTVSTLQETHLITEKMVKASDLPYTIIREGVYTEAFPLYLSWHPNTTSIILPGDGLISFASRYELAEGTARLLLSSSTSYINSTVLLTGPSVITFTDIVALIREVMQKEITLEVLPEEEYVRRVVAAGERPEWFARMWSSTFKAFMEGEANVVDGTLEKLLGRKPRGAEEVIRQLLEEGKGSEERGYTWHQNGKAKESK